MKRILLAMACVALTLIQGCAVIDAVTPDDVIEGLPPAEADKFITEMAGVNTPRAIRIERFYVEKRTKTTDTKFWCTNNDRLNSMIVMAITKHEGNRLEVDESYVEECDDQIARYKLVGSYGSKWLFLRLANAATSRIWAYEIESGGSGLRFHGDYKKVNGVFKFTAANPSGTKRSNGGYWFTSKFESTTDPEESYRELVAMHQRFLGASRSAPSITGQQIAQFAGLVAQARQDQAARTQPPSGLPLAKVETFKPPVVTPATTRTQPAAASATATTTNVNRQAAPPSSPQGGTAAAPSAKTSQPASSQARHNQDSDRAASRTGTAPTAAGTTVASLDKSTPQRTPPASASGREPSASSPDTKTAAAEPTKLALAFCWENKKGGKWWCDGRIQELILAEPDINSQLSGVGCRQPTRLSTTQVTLTRKRNGEERSGWIYGCGENLKPGDTGNMTWNRDIRRFWNGINW